MNSQHNLVGGDGDIRGIRDIRDVRFVRHISVPDTSPSLHKSGVNLGVGVGGGHGEEVGAPVVRLDDVNTSPHWRSETRG